MSREELMKLSAEEMKARLEELKVQLKESDPKKLKEVNDQIKELLSVMEERADNERLDLLKSEKNHILEKPKGERTDAEKARLDEIKKLMRKIYSKKNQEQSKTKPDKKTEKEETGEKSEKPKTEKPSDKSKTDSNPKNEKSQGQSKNEKKDKKSDNKNQQSKKDRKVVVDTEEIAKLKEELKKSAEKRKIYKAEGSYELEAIEASKYSKLVEKISDLQELQRLPKIKEKIAKLQEELKECAEKRRMYKDEGSYELEAIEASKYSEIVAKISELQKPIRAREEREQKARREEEKRQKIAKLQEELKECAEKRRMYKDEGSYELEAIEASKYSEIVAKISELENEGKENSKQNTDSSKSESTKDQSQKDDQSRNESSKAEESKEESKIDESQAGTSTSLVAGPKENRLKKMAKGVFGAIGRKLAQIWNAIKNGPIGKPFKYVFSRIGNKGVSTEQLPWREKMLRFLQISEELDYEEEIDEQKENDSEKDNVENKEKDVQRVGDAKNPEGTHKTISSIIEAMKSAKSQENSDYTEMTFEEDTGKSVETESTNAQSQEKSDVEETKKKVEEGMKSESISYGGCEFTGMSKAIVSKVMDGKVLLHSQLLTTKDGKQVFINPDKTLTAEPKVKSDGPKPRSNGEQKTINATVDENGRVVEDDEMEV